MNIHYNFAFDAAPHHIATPSRTTPSLFCHRFVTLYYIYVLYIYRTSRITCTLYHYRCSLYIMFSFPKYSIYRHSPHLLCHITLSLLLLLSSSPPPPSSHLLQRNSFHDSFHTNTHTVPIRENEKIKKKPLAADDIFREIHRIPTSYLPYAIAYYFLVVRLNIILKRENSFYFDENSRLFNLLTGNKAYKPCPSFPSAHRLVFKFDSKRIKNEA